MSKKNILYLISGFVLALVFVSINENLVNVIKPREMTKLNYIASELKKNYKGKVTRQKLVDNIYKGIAENFDDYTCYYTAKEQKYVKTKSNEEFGGIGIKYKTVSERMYITKVYKGYVADRAGLEKDDEIIKIDGVYVNELLRKPMYTLRGKVGTKVVLTIGKPDGVEKFDVTLTREKINIPKIKIKSADKDTMYVSFSDFSKESAKEFSEAIQKNKKRNIIIDLRGNSGGEVKELQNILKSIVPSDIICLLKDKKNNVEKIKVNSSIKKVQNNLVVLVNNNTASCSEIMAGYLQYKGYATVIGTKTFGKGCSQIYGELSDGSALKITNTYWYLPNNKCIQDKGIIPDIELNRDEDVKDFEKLSTDNQVQKALEVLKGE